MAGPTLRLQYNFNTRVSSPAPYEMTLNCTCLPDLEAAESYTFCPGDSGPADEVKRASVRVSSVVGVVFVVVVVATSE